MNSEETNARLGILKDLLKTIEASSLLDDEFRKVLADLIGRKIKETVEIYT